MVKLAASRRPPILMCTVQPACFASRYIGRSWPAPLGMFVMACGRRARPNKIQAKGGYGCRFKSSPLSKIKTGCAEQTWRAVWCAAHRGGSHVGMLTEVSCPSELRYQSWHSHSTNTTAISIIRAGVIIRARRARHASRRASGSRVARASTHSRAVGFAWHRRRKHAG